jgi:hypothetical protein
MLERELTHLFDALHRLIQSVEARDSHRLGWSECLDRLAGYLSETSKQGALK